VTKAIYDYWEYYAPIAEYAPPACSVAQQTFTHIVDNIIIGKKKNTKLVRTLKSAFGLGNLTHSDDFANELSSGVSNWQSLNWDPELSSPEFYNFCSNLTSTTVLYPATESLRTTAAHLISQGGYKANATLTTQFLNYMGYINMTVAQPCVSENSTLDECYNQHDPSIYTATDYASQSWRSWAYQYCTEWGFLQTGSGVPANQLPLISRTIDLPYTSLVCKYGFNITSPPDTEAVNKYGGYNISYPRLAFIDGEQDPWRPATPHAYNQGAQRRWSTVDEPFVLIEGAVHHWDENGLFANETTGSFPPGQVVSAQRDEHDFVAQWVAEWKYKMAEEGKDWY
jgi:hypothetical protein